MLIPIYNSKTIKPQELRRIMQRSSANYDKVREDIRPIMETVKANGDAAILNKYAKRKVPLKNITVTKDEFIQAYAKISPNFLKAFNISRQNLAAICQAQLKSAQETCLVNSNGVKVWREWRPLESVGIYAPGGRANYPSTLLMCALPAIISGCKRIIACAPPNEQGELPAELLVTAAELGIVDVYKVGGPQAIAAMAYGTQTIPQVLKIVGPGNQYVNAAKLNVFPQTSIDMPAGPSENLIIADESANPTFVAADLITDAEHGPDSTAILLTNSLECAEKTISAMNKLISQLSTKEVIKASLKHYGAILITQSLNEAVFIANEYAPEHMQIMTQKSMAVAQQITNAGSVFIGPWSSKAAGDYCTGANHVLPTGQSAKSCGPLSVESFGKWVEFQKLSKQGFMNLQRSISTFAEVEKLPAHKLSATCRV